MDTRNLVRHANQILSHFFVIFWIKIPVGIYEDLDMCVCEVKRAHRWPPGL